MYELCLFFTDSTEPLRSKHDSQSEATAAARLHSNLGRVECWEIVRLSDGEVVDFYDSKRSRAVGG